MTVPGGAPIEPQVRPARSAGRTRRQEYERRQRRRSTVVAAVSTLVVGTLIVVGVTSAPRWPEVRRSFFDGDHFRASFPQIVDAFWLNVRVFLVAEACILVLALLVAVARSSRSAVLFPVRVLSTVYVDLFRGVPVLLVLFLLGFGVPALRIGGVPNDPVFWAGVALVLSYSAYVSEVYRAGIDSVHDSQRLAALSLGLSTFQSLRYVVLPQAVRRVIPPLLNDFIALQKETSLVGILGPIEAARQAQIYSSREFNFTSYVAGALVFLAFTIPLTRLTDHLLARQRRRTTAGRA